ncbi:subtilisin-like protein [Lactarius psammicola]|nr:subtilisin-like protein [Lactarius psammicola]
MFVLFALATGLLGSPAKPLSPPWDDMHIEHSWNDVPKNWECLGRPPSSTTIDLYIALKSHSEDALIDVLYQVSEPTHPRHVHHLPSAHTYSHDYGAHLSREQVAELVAPHPNTLELVNSWLEHHGVPSSSVSMTHGGNTLTLRGVSMTKANALLDASYQLYRHVERGETIVRTVSYALPAVLHGHVLTVAPTTSFTSSRMQWQTARNRSGVAAAGLSKSGSGEPVTVLSRRDDSDDSDDSPDNHRVDYVTPGFLRWLYDTSAYKPVATDRNRLGIVGFMGDYPSPTDLEAFMRKYRSDAVDATYNVVQANNGGYDPSKPHEESNMDIQYAEAMAYPTPHTFYSIGQGPLGKDDPFLSWLEFILKQESIPYTISTSYYVDESNISKKYAVHVCRLFAQLGARGVTVLFASGNDGVGEGNCVARDGSVRFIPSFPATCPFVTGVGGTKNFLPEAASRFSGGGFSNHFERPTFQERAVFNFLRSLGNRYRGLYNPTGRGVPDISAQSRKFRIFFNGQEQDESGTSLATPIAAGIISLLNDCLISRGRKPLGWINPWLYRSGFLALKDITKGKNPGCNTEGFSAIVEWDPVTGLGTPIFSDMLELLIGGPG